MSEEVLSRKEKRKAKLIAKYTNPVDINYRGPLSYRYLRLIAWISFAFGQLLAAYGIFRNIGWSFLPNMNVEILISFISYLSTPLFIVATFGLILSGQKTFKAMIILYAGAYLGIALALIIVYYRYLLGIFQSHELASGLLSQFGFILKINVFGDLLAFCLFHYFITGTPKKYFQGKKIIYFRLLAILPALFVLASYLIKVLASYEKISVPFAIVPFIATKPPMVLLLFAIVSLWFNYRQIKFKKLGLTKADYNAYLKTNRNSLSFSIMLSITIAVFSVLETILVIILFGASSDPNYLDVIILIQNLSIGETIPLILIVPFVLLYSYTRGHKNNTLDIILPVAGIGMSLIVYAEVIYQFFVQVVWA